MKTDKSTESSVDKSANWKKLEYNDWGKNSWSSQSWDANSYTIMNWANKNKSWNDKHASDSKNMNKKQKTTSDSEKKEREWRQRQAIAYTTHYRGILTAIMPFPAYYYGINKGKYPIPGPGQHCDPTTVYSIPTGEHMEFGRTHPAMASLSHPLNPDYPLGPDIPGQGDDDTKPDEITPMLWNVFRKKQEEQHQQCTKATFENKIAARRHEMDVEAALVKTKKDSIINHGGTTKVDKRGNYTVAAEGGLPLTHITIDHVHDPDEDKKTSEHKSEKSNQAEDRSPYMQPELNEKDEMSDEQKQLRYLLNDAMENMVKDKDLNTQMMLKTLLEVYNTNKSNPAASSSKTSPEAAAPADIKTEKEEATDPGDKRMTKVSLSEASDEESEDHAY